MHANALATGLNGPLRALVQAALQVADRATWTSKLFLPLPVIRLLDSVRKRLPSVLIAASEGASIPRSKHPLGRQAKEQPVPLTEIA